MNCIVTAGPTYETMDHVRRLTNFSTGRLGTELANFLVGRGHQVTLLIGEQATHSGERPAHQVQVFSTTENLREKLRTLAEHNIGVVFHAAAVSDFKFGKIWLRSPSGDVEYPIHDEVVQFLCHPPSKTDQTVQSLRRLNEIAASQGWRKALAEVYGDGSDMFGPTWENERALRSRTQDRFSRRYKMKIRRFVFAFALVFAALPAAAGQISGNYVEFRTADVYTGPCFANGEMNLAGHEAVLGWQVSEGQWNGVPLAGLNVVAVVRANARSATRSRIRCRRRPCSSWMNAPTPRKAPRSSSLRRRRRAACWTTW